MRGRALRGSGAVCALGLLSLVQAALQPPAAPAAQDAARRRLACTASRLHALAATTHGEVCFADFGGGGGLLEQLVRHAHSLGSPARSLLVLGDTARFPALQRWLPYCHYDKSELFVVGLGRLHAMDLAFKLKALQALRVWHFQARLLLVDDADGEDEESDDDGDFVERVFSVLWAQSLVNVFFIRWNWRQGNCETCECLKVFTYNPFKHKEFPTKPIVVQGNDYSVTDDMHGYTLRLAMVDTEPYVYIRNSSSGKPVLQGQDGSLLREVLKHLNASYAVVRPDDDLPHGFFTNKTINGVEEDVLNGAMGMVAYGKADMAANSWVMDPPWRHLVEYTYPHDQDNYCMLVHSPKRVPFVQLLFMPFFKEVWYAIGFSLVVTACVRTLYRMFCDIKQIKNYVNHENCADFSTFEETELHLGGTDLHSLKEGNTMKNYVISPIKIHVKNSSYGLRGINESNFLKFGSSLFSCVSLFGLYFFETFRIYLTGMLGYLPTSGPDRILFSVLGFASVTLICSYQDSIVSFLTVPEYQREIDSLKEVNEEFQKIYTYPYFLQVFTDLEENDIVISLKEKFSSSLTEAEWAGALRAVRAGAAAALLTRTRAAFFRALRAGGVRVAREPALSPAHAHLAVRAASPLLRPLDRLLARAVAAGLPKRWRSQTRHDFVLAGIFSDEEPRTHRSKERLRKASSLRLAHVQAALCALGAGLAAAAAALAVEVAWARARARTRGRAFCLPWVRAAARRQCSHLCIRPRSRAVSSLRRGPQHAVRIPKASSCLGLPQFGLEPEWPLTALTLTGRPWVRSRSDSV